MSCTKWKPFIGRRWGVVRRSRLFQFEVTYLWEMEEEYVADYFTGSENSKLTS